MLTSNLPLHILEGIVLLQNTMMPECIRNCAHWNLDLGGVTWEWWEIQLDFNKGKPKNTLGGN